LYGIGEVKLEKYGQKFINILGRYSRNHQELAAAAVEDELTIDKIKYRDGNHPSPLDVIKISLKSHSPHFYQTENHLLDERAEWVKVARFSKIDLPSLCDNTETLWVNGYHTVEGSNDRIPIELANAQLTSSLLFIAAETFRFFIKKETLTQKRKIRAEFVFNGILYNLTVTDPVFESIYVDKDPGEYHLNDKEIFLCISLGEPYEGYCYKLVAAVITC
jgi:hypothetical protein